MKVTQPYILLLLLFAVSSLFFSYDLHSQGIQFTGSNKPIEHRSSVRLFEQDHPNFRSFLDIKFDLHIKDDETAGYLLRLKDNGQNPTYNLYFDKENGAGVFRFNEEGKSGLIRLSIAMDKLKKQRWLPVHIAYDLQTGKISLSVGDVAAQSVQAARLDNYSPVIVFGKSDYLIDVPSISLRNLVIADGQREFVFPMRESTGQVLHDASGVARGKVSKITWLLNHAYHWDRTSTMYSSRKAGSEYDLKNQLAYYFNSDSLYIHHLREGFTESIRFASPCPILIKLGNTFIDTVENRLYVYETFYEHPYTGPTMASLSLQDYTWRIESDKYLGLELNHHGALYMQDHRSLYVFGGFGNMLYNNNLMGFSLSNKEWTEPQSISKEEILPRYFTSMGYGATTKKMYLFGGMGNESGQHIVGRKYFYDLYEIDPARGTSKKLWEQDWKEPHFVPARGLVIPDDDWVYMLGYPEHVTHSLIKLRRFSLHDGSYEELGDSIPIYSDKISTRAKLYHDKNLQKLVALVQESDDDIRSKLSVYELDFPAISQAQLHAFPGDHRTTNGWWIGFAAVLLLCGGVALYWRNKSKQTTAIEEKGTADMAMQAPVEPVASKPDAWKHPDRNAIFLFGDFTVLDRRGNDISHLFSTRLRQVFCLLLVHSTTAGISSNLLSHLIWPDKPKDKVKTSRGVTINNLRKALNGVDGVEIIYENGHYRVAISPPCYCDYTVVRSYLTTSQHHLPEDINLLLRRGSFLLGFDDPLFDDTKGKLDDELISSVEKSIAARDQEENWTLLFAAADLLMVLDPVHEIGLRKGLKALIKLSLTAQASRFYTRFAEQHRLLLGEEYPHSFGALLASIK